MAQDKPLQIKDIPLTGKWITSVNRAVVGENFITLENMRYTETNPETIGGMTKINTTALSTYLKIRSGNHFFKDQPSENHVLVQAYNTGLTGSQVLQNTTAIPGQGDFSATALHTDGAGAGIGRFASSPLGESLYCNGVESLIWPGDEQQCSGFVSYNPDGSFSYDYTDEVANTLTTKFATANLSEGGLDSSTVLLLHLDNNVTDSSPTTPHTVTNNNVTFSSSDKIFGTHSAVFNGTNAYLSIPDDDDFNFGAAIGTMDCRVKVDDLTDEHPLYYQDHEMQELTFTSGGTYEVSVDDTIEGNLSGATAIIEEIVLSSGSWAGGDAAGTFYFRSADKTGTFQSENLNVGAQTNVATISGDSSVAGTDYNELSITTSGAIQTKLFSVSGNNSLTFTSTTGIITPGNWYHVAFVVFGNDYYLFVDGILRGYVSSTAVPQNHTAPVLIGYDGTNYLTGKLDEFRLSSTARWTSDFDIPVAAYSASDTSAYFYVGSIRPIKGMKLYVGTANTTSGSTTVQYWNGSVWLTASSIVDGTESGGVPLAQTGTVTFSDTDGTAQIKFLNQGYIYWYRLIVNGCDATTTIYNVTLSASMQTIKDIWDGQQRDCFAFYKFTGGTYQDNTINIREEDFSSANTGSYADISSLGTAGFITAGFTERIAGLIVTLVSDRINSASGIIATVKYWDGSDWTSVGNIDDGTLENSTTLAKSGMITWQAPDETLEFRTETVTGKSTAIETVFGEEVITGRTIPVSTTETSISTSTGKQHKLYYYRVEFSGTLSSSVFIDTIKGIPAQNDIRGFKFPLHAQDRVWLCSDQTNDKNSAIVSANSTSVVFNGRDTTRFYFGDDKELTAGTSIYSQFGSSLYTIVIICKKTETWIITGSGPESWTKFRVSERIGCAAPLTMTQAHVDVDVLPGFNRNICIWQAVDGIYIFDGRTFLPIHRDIDDVFEKRNSSGINRDKIEDSVGFFDTENQEWHWLWASGTSTTLDKEYVFDMQRQKWYEIKRPEALQFGMEVIDTKGNNYDYGAIDTGYLERLENGNDFDGTPITATLQTGDIYLSGTPMIESTVRNIKLTMAAKTSTSNNVTLEHYPDTSSTATISREYSSSSSGYSVAMPLHREGLGPYSTHSFKLSMTTDNETIGFEPLILSLAYKHARIDQN